MGRLAGFSYRQITARLSQLGFVLYRQSAGSHELWRHPGTRRGTVIPAHRGDVPEGTLRGILKLAGVSIDDFLA